MTHAADLPFVVKVCGITNEEDAREAVAAGAQALGFNFYPNSPRFIASSLASQIIEAVPGSYLRVGVFVNTGDNELFQQHLSEIARAVPLDVYQLHGARGPVSFPGGARVWRSIAPQAAPATDESFVEAFLLDTPSPEFGGSGQTFDWSLAQNRTHRILLAGGLDASNVAQAIRIAQPWGVDACSRLESSPGKKDPERVRAFVRAALETFESAGLARPTFPDGRNELTL